MAKLILVRHGQSEWNEKGLWTGWTDIPLTEKGRQEARAAGEVIAKLDIKFDIAYTSCLWRAWETLHEITTELKVSMTLPVSANLAYNERDYGDLTAKNKWQVRDEYGEEKFTAWRRGWDFPVPGGETLKDVYARVVPFYESTTLADLKAGRNVLVSAHGNSLRALIKHLDNTSDDDVTKLELGTGEVVAYDIDADGKVTAKQTLQTGGKA